MANVPAIEVTDLTKNYGSLRAVDRLSMSVDYGSVVGFVGPNGAGKTTTLRSIVGHVMADSGHALVAGTPYRELAYPLRTVGAVLETGAMHPGRSGRNHLRVLARQGGISQLRVDELIERVGLGAAARRRVHGYSMGMRQRLALAAALLGDPRILLLDEPANGLDPDGIRWLREFLRELAAEGRAVLVSSHGLAELAQTVEEVVIIGHGHLITQAPLPELMKAHAAAQVLVRVSDAERLAQALPGYGHSVVARDGDQLTVDGADARGVHRVAAGLGVDVDHLTVAEPTLEEIYFQLTSGKETIR